LAITYIYWAYNQPKYKLVIIVALVIKDAGSFLNLKSKFRSVVKKCSE